MCCASCDCKLVGDGCIGLRVLYVSFYCGQQGFNQSHGVLGVEHLLHPHKAVALTLRHPASVLDHLCDLLPNGVILQLLPHPLVKQDGIQCHFSLVPVLEGVQQGVHDPPELDPFLLRVGGLDLGEKLAQADLDQSEILPQVQEFRVMDGLDVPLRQGVRKEFCSSVGCQFKYPFVYFGGISECAGPALRRPASAVPHADIIARQCAILAGFF